MSAADTHTRAADDALAMLAEAEPQWRRMDAESLGAELEMASIMPGNGRADVPAGICTP